MTVFGNQLHGPTDPARDAHWAVPEPRKGFFTDTSICIGCKACEVACKEWNHVPQDGDYALLGTSYDNTGHLGASTWRHVAFIEQGAEDIAAARETGRELISLGMPTVGPPEDPVADDPVPELRWLMSSNVCKHCTHAGCLDVCPTGALFRTEYGTVVVQADVCNGCGYCVAACPFGVIERRDGGTVSNELTPVHNEGVAQKCTLCYDRISHDQTPSCAQACPTTSIKYGDHDDLLDTARARVGELHAEGKTEARLYGANDLDGVGGTGAFFLLLDEPEVYGLPPDPRVPTADLPQMFRKAGIAGLGMLAAAAVSFLGGRS
ncbi:4Fe-4S dicluster domain-containing protein [Nocardioides rotundus]|uniref:4Fe-4S dicluster domain-containing protein n=1 Tax=Nocardioides rotundus TaxID=1774216 RepID=UPI001CBAC3C4|nr:4Fe-4S dicluster domain-containing protein [Nocardioides rotundus]UAL30331.1 4Fe-4S dicluster domain-containing protein [Nocardioides rotundus]